MKFGTKQESHTLNKCCSSIPDSDEEDEEEIGNPQALNKGNTFLDKRKRSMLPHEEVAIGRTIIKDNNQAFSDSDEGIKVKFKPYREIIENLTNSFILQTDGEDGEKDLVIECMLSKD